MSISFFVYFFKQSTTYNYNMKGSDKMFLIGDTIHDCELEDVDDIDDFFDWK